MSDKYLERYFHVYMKIFLTYEICSAPQKYWVQTERFGPYCCCPLLTCLISNCDIISNKHRCGTFPQQYITAQSHVQGYYSIKVLAECSLWITHFIRKWTFRVMIIYILIMNFNKWRSNHWRQLFHLVAPKLSASHFH